jgi:hypothetical protein
MLGYPQLAYHTSTNSFGLFGVYSLRESIFVYKSAVRYDPILQMNLVQEKNQHISALLISMLLQLEKDGFISLNDYPSGNVMNEEYSSEFNQFVNSYYEESRRSYKGSNYIEYGERIKDLWSARQSKPRKHKNWLGGAISNSAESVKTIHGPIEVSIADLTCSLLESKHKNGKNETIPRDLIQQRMGTFSSDPNILKKYKNCEHFIGKPHANYIHNIYGLNDE